MSNGDIVEELSGNFRGYPWMSSQSNQNEHCDHRLHRLTLYGCKDDRLAPTTGLQISHLTKEAFKDTMDVCNNTAWSASSRRGKVWWTSLSLEPSKEYTVSLWMTVERSGVK
ncbi:hypothetical protein V5O48_007741 [Marasmius crinis-equi]|uniref:Uncharacterized protein n=1 Tax=Marasmius crinis-equi TaxID=585013 RepID=A0ABR3FFS4_9AGAR